MAEVNLLPAYLINGEDQLKRETVLKRLRSRLEAISTAIRSTAKMHWAAISWLRATPCPSASTSASLSCEMPTI